MQRESAADRFELRPRQGEVARVKVEPDQPPAGQDAVQQLNGMAAESDSAIDNRLPRPWVEGGQNFVEQHGNVAGFARSHGRKAL
jgi:hypothetical protein